MSRIRRQVRVHGLVDVEETEGPQDQGIAYAHVATALLRAAEMRISGGGRSLLGIEHPLLQFSVDSGPCVSEGEEKVSAWAAGLDAAGVTSAALDLAGHLAHSANDVPVWDRVTALQRRWQELQAAEGPDDAAAAGLVRAILEALCRKNGLSLAGETEPGIPARNYELALRLGIGSVFGLPEDEHARPPLPQLYWAPYQEFGIPDPAKETHEPPALAFTVGSVGYRGNDIIIYWTAAQ